MEENELIPVDNNNAVEYTDDNIRHLSDMEHVRTRPGMYIGRLGDGAHAEDGIQRTVFHDGMWYWESSMNTMC